MYLNFCAKILLENEQNNIIQGVIKMYRFWIFRSKKLNVPFKWTRKHSWLQSQRLNEVETH